MQTGRLNRKTQPRRSMLWRRN